MKKYKHFTNFDKEEKWLNDMAKQGYRFVAKRSFCYEFAADAPDNAIIKVDYRTFKKKEDFEEYLFLFEDSGWTHLSGSKSSGYQYFRKADPRGSDDIFSDIDSKAGRYKRLADMWETMALTFIPILTALLVSKAIDPGVLLDPKSIYYTPGLWDMEGAAFWRAFLFETPFAILRGCLWAIPPLTFALYLIFAYKAHKQFKLTQENKIIR
ncbi:DUF2812 domain-containing protein [Cohnella sp. AR92]|uniref:DUF2812 domain-containing protein n=1 Tax=Cohnella sp. AR92 TaxID=648716 RepID=UPI000F8F2C03|nr:DUF2812 domain-containing protein [Cohnella sp. AR92]RUS47637.1 DUF2812 domain-containing protein [Cohnella sp. AR92]